MKFGLKPKKTPAPLTSTQLAVRAAKVKATRELRGTKSSKQKKAIKAGPMQVSIGPVVASTVVPAVAPGVASATPVAASVAAANTPPLNATVGETSPVASK